MSDKPLTPREMIDLANMLAYLKTPVVLFCDYTNWRGERRRRQIHIRHFWHGATEWHPEPSLMVNAIDMETGVVRDFRVADFHTDTLETPDAS